ncbi:hypothetical protein TYRP_022763 [Tyrophagus putrescentiae]|nr:hypothetical protein TYRP_022763 [Tyrophagus putrescentiae]
MLLHFLYTSIVRHLYTLQHLYDPITTGDDDDHHFMGQSSKKISLEQPAFLYPLLFIPLSEVVGVLGLELDAVGRLFSWRRLSTSPYILMHQVMLQVVWPQMDVFFYLIVNGCILSAAALYTAPMINDDAHRLTVVVTIAGDRCLRTGQQRINASSSRTILKYRALVLRHFYLLLWGFLAVQYSYLYLMVYINGAFQWSIISCFYWFVIFPIAGFYVVFVFLGMPIIMTISIVVILVQQREALQQLSALNEQLQALDHCHQWAFIRAGHHPKLLQLKLAYHQLNERSVHLCSAIAATSRQWSAYLSTALPVHILSISYLAYTFFFGRIPLLLKYMFVTGSATIVAVLFLHINLCAQVVRFNGAQERHCTVFIRRLQRLGGGGGGRTRAVFSPGELLKFQSTAEQRWLFAFKFINEHPINSSTFPLFFSYCTIFILMIAKRS